MTKRGRIRIAAPALAAAVAVALAAAFAPAPDARADHDADRIAEKTIRAAVPASVPPQFGLDEGGHPRGFAIEVMDKVARVAGVAVVYIVEPDWAGVDKAIREGRAEAVPNMGITEDRKRLYDFTRPYETITVSMFARKGASVAGDPREPIVGVVTTDVAANFLASAAEMGVTEYPDAETALLALLTGRIDRLAYPTDAVWALAGELGVDNLIEASGPPLITVERAIAVRKGNPELVARLDAALGEVMARLDFKDRHAAYHGAREPAFWTTNRMLWAAAGVLAVVLVVTGIRRYGIRMPGDKAELAPVRRPFLTLVVIMSALIGVVSTVTLLSLYRAQVADWRDALAAAAREQATLIAVATQFAESGKWQIPVEVRDDVLDTVIAAARRYTGRGELTVGTAKGDQIAFFFRGHGEDRLNEFLVPLDSPNAAPMRRALLGRSRMLTGPDYRGVEVLAAYAPVPTPDPDLRLGAVVKTDMAAIRAPFVRASGIVAVVAIVLIGIGSELFFRLTRPIVESIVKRKQRLRGAIESLQEGFVLFDADDRVVAMNDVYRRINPQAQEFMDKGLGFEALLRAGVAKGRIVDAVGREEEFVQERLKRHFDPTVPMLRQISDGAWYVIKESKTPEGGIAMTFADVTALMRTEQRLRESEARFKQMAETASDWFWELDEDLRFSYFSERSGDAAYFPADGVIGKHPWELPGVAPLGDGAWDAHRADLEAHRLFRDFECALRVGEECFYVSANGDPFFDADGTFKGYRGTTADITGRVRAEEAVRRSEARLRGAVESMQEGFALFDADDRIVMANDIYRRINPYAEEHIKQGKTFEETLRANVERGGITKAEGRVEEFIATRMARHRDPRGPTIRRYTDGRSYMLKETRTPDGGTALTLTDVTALKDVSDRLADSEVRFRDFAEATSDWFFEMDENLRFTGFMGERLEKAGLSSARFVGKTRWEAVGADPDTDDKWRRHRAKIEAHEPFRDFRYDATDDEGRPIVISASGKPVFDGDGTFRGYRGTGSDVTEQTRAAKALRESEARFRDLAENTPDMIWQVDENAVYTYVNPRVRDLLGYEPEEVIGKTSFDLMPPDDAERERKKFEEWRNLRAPVAGLENRNLRKDGRIVILETSAVPVFDNGGNFTGYRGVDRDITGRKQAEEHLRKLSHAVEQSPASILITDRDGAIEYVNSRFTEITGYSAAEAIGKTPRILKSGETPPKVYERLWRAIAAGREWRGTLRNRRKDGTVYLSGNSISPIRGPDGAITNFVGAQQDITERVDAERRLKQAEKMESLGSLAGGIAHDFNNMLLPIIALSDMALKGMAEDDRNRHRLEHIRDAGTRAKELVVRILAFSRREEAAQGNIDIHEVVLEAMELLRSTLPTTIKITESLDKETGVVFADRAQLSSVLMNLAGNAADAIEGRTGTISISLAPVDVDAETMRAIINLRPGAYARLRVADDGHGMDAETLARVMDPFFTTKPVGQGTGLGLSMVHGIVSKHGGAIDIESTPGEGTTIDVYLPQVAEHRRTLRQRTRKRARPQQNGMPAP